MAKVVALALVLIVIAAAGNAGMVEAQSPPPSSCTAPLLSLVPSLAFLQGGANKTTPTQACCTALASVVNTSATCLCQLITYNTSPRIRTRALALPGACNITTLPLSECNVSSNLAAVPPTPVAASPNAGLMMGVSWLNGIINVFYFSKWHIEEG